MKDQVEELTRLGLRAFAFAGDEKGEKTFDRVSIFPDLCNRTVRQSNPIEHQSFDCRTQSNIIELTIKFYQSNTIERSITERLVIEPNRTFDHRTIGIYVDKIIFYRHYCCYAGDCSPRLHVTLGYSGEPGESNGCSEVPSAYYNINFKHNFLCCCCLNGAIFLC